MRVVSIEPNGYPIEKEMSEKEILSVLGEEYKIIQKNGNSFLVSETDSQEYNCTIDGRRILGTIICVSIDADIISGLNDKLVRHYINLPLFVNSHAVKIRAERLV